MSYRQTNVSGFPAVALRSTQLEIVAVPAIGMKLTNLRRLNGREWLWRSDQIPLAPPKPGASYVETADSGGWDECFPTVGAGPIPGAPPGTPLLPDHGELWSAPWDSSVFENQAGTTLAGSAQGTVFPYEFHRTVALDLDEPIVQLSYALRHSGATSFPWIWSAHPLLNVQPGSVLELPGVTQVKIAAVHGRDDLSENDVVSWPGAIGGDAGRFTFPESGAWAVKLFGDFAGEGRMVLTDPRRGERLEMRVSPDQVPQVGLWINCRGWAPPGRHPYYNLALEPCIGAPDRLDIAVRDWHTAQTLQPGEERKWSVSLWLPDKDD
jgi:galactose mutarotase-like enzyme